MGAALACCACNAATCVGGRICSSVTGTCGRAAKKSAFMGRLLYAVVLLLVAVLALLMKNLPTMIDSTEYLKMIPGAEFHANNTCTCPRAHFRPLPILAFYCLSFSTIAYFHLIPCSSVRLVYLCLHTTLMPA